jgi:hypothetical protein
VLEFEDAKSVLSAWFDLDGDVGGDGPRVFADAWAQVRELSGLGAGIVVTEITQAEPDSLFELVLTVGLAL